jgi:hypothetical protein
MYLNVKERGDHVATFRWIGVRLMEMLAAWVPTTPEMEVKLVFGAHIWDAAQHADALGKRTHELRLPLQHSLEPASPYVQFLNDLASAQETSKRVAGFYDLLLPGLDQRFRDYLNQVDTLLDAPTVRILERIMADSARMVTESRVLRNEVPEARLADQGWLNHLRERQAAIRELVVHRAPDPAAVTAG